jgi:hypothetical protein
MICGGIAPWILCLGIRRRSAISYTPRHVCPLEASKPVDKVKHLFLRRESNSRFLGSLACSSYTAWPNRKSQGKAVLNQALRHGDVWGRGGIAPPFLTSAVDEDEWSASRPDRFTPGKKFTVPHWIGWRVGTRAGLGDVGYRKVLYPPRIQ